MVRAAAASFASKGIRINAAAPGLVNTPLTHQHRCQRRRRSRPPLPSIPYGRIGEPSDVAQGISWLLDPKNAWITGQVIPIDGGLSSIKLKM
jgi:NAD(P)-dependent dehydrogenase (short-subunit alcohol dehydrogenase family)